MAGISDRKRLGRSCFRCMKYINARAAPKTASDQQNHQQRNRREIAIGQKYFERRDGQQNKIDRQILGDHVPGRGWSRDGIFITLFLTTS